MNEPSSSRASPCGAAALLRALDELTPRPREKHFRQAMAEVRGLYLILTPNLEIVTASDGYLAATETRLRDISGCGIFEVFPDNPNQLDADGVSNLSRSLRNVQQRGGADAMPVQRYDIQTHEGRWEERYWNPMNTPIIPSGSREVTYIVHQVEDVSAIHKAHQWRRAFPHEVSSSPACLLPGYDLLPAYRLLRDLGEAAITGSTGTEALHSGLYAIIHASGRCLARHDSFLRGNFFPVCRRCGEPVRYRLLYAAPGAGEDPDLRG